MKSVIGIPFGDPRHPFRQTTEQARKAGKLGKVKSPWNRFAMDTKRRKK